MSKIETPSSAELDARMAALEAHLEQKLEAAVAGAAAHGGAPGDSLAALEKLESETQALAHAAEQWKHHSAEGAAGQMLASALGRMAGAVGAIADRLAERIRGATGLFKAPPPKGAPPTPPVPTAKPPKAKKPVKARPPAKTKAPKVHTVKSGDTLHAIAERNHISLARLIKANRQIGNPDLIYPGDRIKIPGKSASAERAPADGAGNAAKPSKSGGMQAVKPKGASGAMAAVKPKGASGAMQAVQASQVGGAAKAHPPRGSVAAKVMRFRDEINAAAKKYHVPAALIAATIEHESGGNPNARSFDGGHGKGLMQIDDRFHSLARSSKVFDPVANINYGAKLIAANLKAFPGNQRAGIAAFNAGVGGVSSALKRGNDPSSATYAPGYISKIQASMRKYDKYL